MSIRRCMQIGLGRVLANPGLILWLYLGLVLLALPLSLIMRDTLRESFGGSLVQDNLLQGFDLNWWGEFRFEESGLAETFSPSIVGALPSLTHVETLLDGRIFNTHPAIVATGLLFLLLWAFLAGGILDRYAHPEEEHGIARFFSRGAEYFFRFSRLLVISILAYLALLRWVGEPLHDLVREGTRDLTVERTAMFYTLGVFGLIGLALLLVSMILDYARISIVCEGRRSVVLAIFRATGFVTRHFRACAGIYLSVALAALLLFLVYFTVAPGPGQSTWSTILLAFLAGQLYLAARIAVKLWFLAAQTSYFRAGQALEVPAEPPDWNECVPSEEEPIEP